MSENINVKIQLDNAEANQKLNQTGEAAKDAGSKSKSGFDGAKGSLMAYTVAIGAAVVAMKKLAAMANEYIKLAEKQVNAEIQLKNALGRTDTELIKYAGSLQKVTKFGDEATIQAMAMVGAFTQERDVIKQLMPLIQDFATAKGMDLVSASDMVARSIFTENNLLGRHGIELKGATGSTQRLAEATKVLNDRWGGLSKEMANTPFGELEQLKNNIGDIKESIGKELVGAQIAWNKAISFGFGEVLKIIQLYKEFTGIDFDAKVQLAVDETSLDAQLKRAEKMGLMYGQRLRKGLLDTGLMQEGTELTQKHVDSILKRVEGEQKENLEKIIVQLNRSADRIDELKAKIKERDDAAMGESPSIWTPEALAWEKAQQDAHIQSLKDAHQKAIDDWDQAEQDRHILGLEHGRLWDKIRQDEANRDQKFADEAVARNKQMLAQKEADARKHEQDMARIKQASFQVTESFHNATVSLIYAFQTESNKAAKEWQVVAIGSAVIDTALAAVKSYQALAGLGPAGPALGAAAAAAAIIFGAAQIATISQQSFATGGIVEGPTSGDNVPIRANGGEAILTRADQTQLLQAIRSGDMGTSSINVNINANTSSSPQEIARQVVKGIEYAKYHRMI